MLDLVGNHIVGFPTRRLIWLVGCCLNQHLVGIFYNKLRDPRLESESRLTIEIYAKSLQKWAGFSLYFMLYFY